MYLFAGLHGHATSRAPGASGTRMDARNERTLFAEHGVHAGTHARHHPHVGDDIRAVGDLHADLRDGTSERTHRKRHDVQRASAHAALEEAAQRAAHLRWLDPVVRRPRILFALAADERAILDARDIRRIGAGKEAVRPLDRIQAMQRAGRDHALACRRVFLVAAVTTVSGVVSEAICATHSTSRRCRSPGGALTFVANGDDDSVAFICSSP